MSTTTSTLNITDEQIAAAVRPLYADDTAASMGLADDIRTVRAVLALQPSASAEPAQEPKVDVEQMLRDCVPGGSSCDPQAICDDIRNWFANGEKNV